MRNGFYAEAAYQPLECSLLLSSIEVDTVVSHCNCKLISSASKMADTATLVNH